MTPNTIVPEELMSQAAYARYRQVTRGYVNKLVHSGVLILRDGKVDVRASDAVLDDRAKVTVSAEKGPTKSVEALELTGEPKTYAAARFEREVYTGRLRRLEFEEKNKLLISSVEVTKTWAKIGEAIKSRLNAMPAKLAPVIAALSDERQVRKAIEAEVNAALRALAAEARLGR